jgi:hypothetical protein
MTRNDMNEWLAKTMVQEKDVKLAITINSVVKPV